MIEPRIQRILDDGVKLFPVSDLGLGQIIKRPDTRIDIERIDGSTKCFLRSDVPREFKNERYYPCHTTFESNYWLYNKIWESDRECEMIELDTPNGPDFAVGSKDTLHSISPFATQNYLALKGGIIDSAKAQKLFRSAANIDLGFNFVMQGRSIVPMSIPFVLAQGSDGIVRSSQIWIGFTEQISIYLKGILFNQLTGIAAISHGALYTDIDSDIPGFAESIRRHEHNISFTTIGQAPQGMDPITDSLLLSLNDHSLSQHVPDLLILLDEAIKRQVTG